MPVDWAQSSVLVTGGNGFLGRVVCRLLREHGCQRLHAPRHEQYDLTEREAVTRMFSELKVDVVIHLAAEVGGIGANMAHPGRFFYANMAMGLHLLEEARIHGLARFVHVGTICSYPKYTPVPFREEDLWNGYPEETNAPYGIAKKAVAVMLDAYHRQYALAGAYVLPVNLYGPHDNFDAESSHVIPALIRKCVEARDRGDEALTCWGTGSASREFLYVDDCAEAIVRAAEVITKPIPINLGTKQEITIRELISLIAEVAGFQGEVRWDPTRPDGQPRRCVDTSRAKELLGWEAKIPLKEGLKRTMEWWQAEGLTTRGEQGS